jgi:serine O-acetyltransferase
MVKKHPRNSYISNGFIARAYLWLGQRQLRMLQRALGILLGTEIGCAIPRTLFMPHPYGIIVGTHAVIEEDVVLMHQVTVGGKDPHWGERHLEGAFPVIRRGAYIGAGAKILGAVEIGEFAIVGANAVVTKNVPAGATVLGQNTIIANGHP